MDNDTNKKQSIIFQNNNEAAAVFSSAKDKVEDIITILDIKPYQAVILILGGVDSIDEKLTPRLTQLFGLGIARAAVEVDAVVVDGGTQAGVMAMMGEGVASRGCKTELIGVAPLNMVSYPGNSTTRIPLEPNHSHFVLVEGNGWGSETVTMFNLVNVLTSKKDDAANTDRKLWMQASEKLAPRKVPALAILADGGQTARNEVLGAVRQNLPIIVVEGSGGLADEIAAAWQKRETLPDDPLMAEIIADGELHFHQLSNSVKGIERLIIRELGIDKVLMQAWETFADYDLNANLQQKKFDWIQITILIVGIIGTVLVISQQLWAPRSNNNLKSVGELFNKREIGWWFVYYILIIIPILLTILLTAANRFKQGSKWLLLRAGAESIKREIYRYRARALYYKENPEQQLSQKVEDITRRTMRTEVNLTSLLPYDKDKGFPPYMNATQGGDDGFSYLMPDRYVEVRLNDQLNYFKKKSMILEKQLKRLYWGTFIIGGIGTFLAAIGQQVWIALTTSIVAAFGTYLGYRQTETTLTKYNQAATDLANVKGWWNALSSEEQSLQLNIDSLVEHTEQVLQSELDGWVQQMQNALAELRKGQETPREKEGNKEPEVRAEEAEAEQNNGKPKAASVIVTEKSESGSAASNKNITVEQSNGKDNEDQTKAESAETPEELAVGTDIDAIKDEKEGDAGVNTNSSFKEKDVDKS